MKVPLTGYVAVFSTMIPPLAGFVKWKTHNKQIKIFTFYCIINAVIAGIEMYLASIKTSNHFVITFGYLAEVLSLALFYYSVTSERIFKKLLIYGCTIFTMYWLVDNLFFSNKLDINQTTAIASRVLVIIMSLLTVQEIYSRSDLHMTSSPVFWISATVLISNSGNVFMLSMINEMMRTSSEYFIFLWHLNWILVIITNVVFTGSFFLKPL